MYILRCRDGSFYTGATKDLAARVRKHEAGTASRYTRARLPVVLVWWCRVRTWGAELREEHRIKGLTRAEKELLVAAGPGRRFDAKRLRRHARRDLGDQGKEDECHVLGSKTEPRGCSDLSTLGDGGMVK